MESPSAQPLQQQAVAREQMPTLVSSASKLQFLLWKNALQVFRNPFFWQVQVGACFMFSLILVGWSVATTERLEVVPRAPTSFHYNSTADCYGGGNTTWYQNEGEDLIWSYVGTCYESHLGIEGDTQTGTFDLDWNGEIHGEVNETLEFWFDPTSTTYVEGEFLEPIYTSLFLAAPIPTLREYVRFGFAGQEDALLGAFREELSSLPTGNVFGNIFLEYTHVFVTPASSGLAKLIWLRLNESFAGSDASAELLDSEQDALRRDRSTVWAIIVVDGDSSITPTASTETTIDDPHEVKVRMRFPPDLVPDTRVHRNLFQDQALAYITSGFQSFITTIMGTNNAEVYESLTTLAYSHLLDALLVSNPNITIKAGPTQRLLPHETISVKGFFRGNSLIILFLFMIIFAQPTATALQFTQAEEHVSNVFSMLRINMGVSRVHILLSWAVVVTAAMFIQVLAFVPGWVATMQHVDAGLFTEFVFAFACAVFPFLWSTVRATCHGMSGEGGTMLFIAPLIMVATSLPGLLYAFVGYETQVSAGRTLLLCLLPPSAFAIWLQETFEISARRYNLGPSSLLAEVSPKALINTLWADVALYLCLAILIESALDVHQYRGKPRAPLRHRAHILMDRRDFDAWATTVHIRPYRQDNAWFTDFVLYLLDHVWCSNGNGPVPETIRDGHAVLTTEPQMAAAVRDGSLRNEPNSTNENGAAPVLPASLGADSPTSSLSPHRPATPLAATQDTPPAAEPAPLLALVVPVGPPPLISLHGVTATVGWPRSKDVLHDVSAHLVPGNTYAIYGSSKCGKSTFLHTLIGDVAITRGLLLFSHGNFRVAVCPQEDSVCNQLTVEEHLIMIRGLLPESDRQKAPPIENVMACTRLLIHRSKLPDQLSGGTRRRLSLAMALLSSPDLLLLDEPTKGVDIEQRREIMQFVRSLANSTVETAASTADTAGGSRPNVHDEHYQLQMRAVHALDQSFDGTLDVHGADIECGGGAVVEMVGLQACAAPARPTAALTHRLREEENQEEKTTSHSSVSISTNHADAGSAAATAAVDLGHGGHEGAGESPTSGVERELGRCIVVVSTTQPDVIAACDYGWHILDDGTVDVNASLDEEIVRSAIAMTAVGAGEFDGGLGTPPSGGSDGGVGGGTRSQRSASGQSQVSTHSGVSDTRSAPPSMFDLEHERLFSQFANADNGENDDEEFLLNPRTKRSKQQHPQHGSCAESSCGHRSSSPPPACASPRSRVQSGALPGAQPLFKRGRKHISVPPAPASLPPSPVMDKGPRKAAVGAGSANSSVTSRHDSRARMRSQTPPMGTDALPSLSKPVASLSKQSGTVSRGASGSKIAASAEEGMPAESASMSVPASSWRLSWLPSATKDDWREFWVVLRFQVHAPIFLRVREFQRAKTFSCALMLLAPTIVMLFVGGLLNEPTQPSLALELDVNLRRGETVATNCTEHSRSLILAAEDLQSRYNEPTTRDMLHCTSTEVGNAFEDRAESFMGATFAPEGEIFEWFRATLDYTFFFPQPYRIDFEADPLTNSEITAAILGSYGAYVVVCARANEEVSSICDSIDFNKVWNNAIPGLQEGGQLHILIRDDQNITTVNVSGNVLRNGKYEVEAINYRIDNLRVFLDTRGHPVSTSNYTASHLQPTQLFYGLGGPFLLYNDTDVFSPVGDLLSGVDATGGSERTVENPLGGAEVPQLRRAFFESHPLPGQPLGFQIYLKGIIHVFCLVLLVVLLCIFVPATTATARHGQQGGALKLLVAAGVWRESLWMVFMLIDALLVSAAAMLAAIVAREISDALELIMSSLGGSGYLTLFVGVSSLGMVIWNHCIFALCHAVGMRFDDVIMLVLFLTLVFPSLTAYTASGPLNDTTLAAVLNTILDCVSPAYQLNRMVLSVSVVDQLRVLAEPTDPWLRDTVRFMQLLCVIVAGIAAHYMIERNIYKLAAHYHRWVIERRRARDPSFLEQHVDAAVRDRTRGCGDGGGSNADTAGTAIAVEIEHLFKVFNVRDSSPMIALHNVSASLRQGEAVALIGHNGSGKTTLFSILTGLLPSSKGSVRVMGLDPIEDDNRLWKHVGYSPQEPSLFPFLTLQEHLTLYTTATLVSDGRTAEIGSSETPAHMKPVLRSLFQQGKRDTLVSQFGMTETRLLSVSLAAIRRPRILFVDEAASGLDPFAALELSAYLAYLCRLHGMTVIATAHEMYALHFANRTIFLEHGHVLHDDGNPEHTQPPIATVRGHDTDARPGGEDSDQKPDPATHVSTTAAAAKACLALDHDEFERGNTTAVSVAGRPSNSFGEPGDLQLRSTQQNSATAI